MSKLLPALLAGLFLGVALGFVLFGGGAAGPDGDLVVAAAQRNSGLTARGSNNGQQPLREPSATESATSHAPPDTVDGVAQLIEQRQRVLPATNGGEIRGVVRDAGGQPLSGVVVRSTVSRSHALDYSTQGDGAPQELKLEELVRKTIEGFHEGLADRREALSGADGQYSLSGLAQGSHSLRAWRKGYVIEALGKGARKVESGETVNFRATPVTELALLVQLPSGAPADLAGVKYTSTLGQMSHSNTALWTPKRPNLRLLPGRYEVSAYLNRSLAARQGLKGEFTSDQQTVMLAKDRAAERILIRLKPQLGIRGRLIVADDVKFENAVVRMMPTPPGREPDLKLLQNAEPSAWVHPSNPEFSFMDLAPGTYAIGVARSWNSSIAAYESVKVREGIVQQDLVLSLPTQANALVVLVVDHQGQPISGVRFKTRVRQGSSTRGSSIQAVEQQQGEYWIEPNEDLESALTELAEGGLEATLSAVTTSHGMKSISLRAGRRKYTVAFGEVGTVQVTVVGYASSGLEGRLKLQLERDGKSSFRNWSSNRKDQLGAEGHQKLGPTEVGKYTLELKLETRQRFRQITIQSLAVTVGPGENFATISIPPLYPLTIHVPGAQSGTIQLRGGNGISRYDNIVAGSFNYDFLPAGEYTLRVRAGQVSGKMSVNVPAQSDINFVPD